MLMWKNCDEEYDRLFDAMNAIFRNNSKMLAFLFFPDRPELRDSADMLLSESGAFSSGEQILIRVALDLWSGEVEVNLWDIVHGLDQSNYQNVLTGLQILRPYQADRPPVVRRQPKLACSRCEQGLSPYFLSN